MGTYVGLGNWTQKGMEQIDKSPERAKHIKERFKELGGQLKEVYICIGEYDFLFICEAPDDLTYSQMMLHAQKSGAIRLKSLRAFGGEEYDRLFSGV